MQDLREWLREVEKISELHCVKAPVDWQEEMAAVAYMVASQTGGQALLFENITGYASDYRVLFNMLGSSLPRIALGIGLPADTSLCGVIQFLRERMGRRIEPRVVSALEAPVSEQVHVGEDIDLLEFPVPKMWPLDGGRYIGTADVIITRDPDTGWHNLGTYRQMVQGPKEVGFYLSPGKDAGLHREKWWKQGKPCPVAAVYGVAPLLYVVGSQTFPKNISEYEFAGGILGEAIEVTQGQTVDLLIPARAEIVVEGLAYPNDTRAEGPFGEFSGYYGRPVGETPVIQVTCIHHRRQPILTSALMADYPACDQALFYGIARAAKVWQDLDQLGVPGIRGVYSYPAAAAGLGMLTISLEQAYPGHAAQVLALAAQCPGAAYYSKWIIAVDEDVDPTDINQVIWAMSTRCDPVADVDFLRDTWSTWLDPSKNPPEERPYGSKALINACRQHKYAEVFSQRSRLRREVYARVCSRWQELGFAGSPPELTDFELSQEKPR